MVAAGPAARRGGDTAVLADHLRQRPDAVPTRADVGLCRQIKRLDLGELIDLVEAVKTRDGEPRVVALYQLWIELAGTGDPKLFAAWYNLGVQFAAAGEQAKAVAAYRNARVLKADLYQAAVNIGLALEADGQPAEAVATWEGALQPNEARTALLNHKGRVLEDLKRLDEAGHAYAQSLLTDPAQPDVLHHWISLRARTCAWPVLDTSLPGVTHAALADATQAMSALALFDDVAWQTRQNAAWIARRIPAAPVRLSPAAGYNHRKIRLGYLSSDYCVHPMAFLVAELFEQHDRSAFEVVGYCATRHPGGAVRERLLAAFDRHVSILAMSDEAAARLIRADEIDILIDLNGLTLDNRLGVLRWRPAPVQMTYLGYNGAVPMPEIDYIVADRTVIPPALAATHQPRPLYLPRCYQPNDGKLPVGPAEPRAAAGLPDDAFVFCCFSTNYKVTDTMFDAWMRILAGVDGAVLWIYADNPRARANMTARAAARGIAAERLIFAERVEPETYRARLALADLFLDTYPYNAGTTASDALRVGLPLVTLAGQSFVSRMAMSLLEAVGAPEGVTDTLDAYVALAVALGRDRDRHGALRAALGGGAAWRRTLGDTPAFTRDLEAAYRSVAVGIA